MQTADYSFSFLSLSSHLTVELLNSLSFVVSEMDGIIVPSPFHHKQVVTGVLFIVSWSLFHSPPLAIDVF